MTKIKIISRTILACFTSIASISILAAIIYFYADYEKNVILNTNIDDFTIGFMFVMLFLFSGVSVLLFSAVFKNKNMQNE